MAEVAGAAAQGGDGASARGGNDEPGRQGDAPTVRVLLLYARSFIPDNVLDLVRASVPRGVQLDVVEESAPPAQRRQAFAEAQVIVAYPGDPRADELDAARQLRLFQLLSAGHDWLDLDDFRRRGIAVATNAGSNAVATAEHTLLLMLALLKQLPPHDAAVHAGEWPAMRHTLTMRELHGRTVGLVGFGRIGQEVALRLHAFGARVVYASRSRAAADVEQRTAARHVALDELLAGSDIVSLHAPLTPTTRRLIDSAALARMRAGSCLVNTARGALVDEGALAAALRSGHLAGVGLDVFADEPLPLDSPLRGLPGVILTPHIGGVTRDTWSRRLALAWANVQRVAAGEKPLSQVA